LGLARDEKDKPSDAAAFVRGKKKSGVRWRMSTGNQMEKKPGGNSLSSLKHLE
jgi:hypothetical protein